MGRGLFFKIDYKWLENIYKCTAYLPKNIAINECFVYSLYLATSYVPLKKIRMIAKPTVFLVVIIFLTSCNNFDKNKMSNSTDTTAQKMIISNLQEPHQDTLIINTKAAVFISPDTIQIEKRKREVGEEDFMTGADDFLFYMNKSHEFLEKQKLKLLDIKDRKFVKFIKEDKSSISIKVDTLPALWNVYLFDPSKAPINIDMTMIEEQYKNYYK